MWNSPPAPIPFFGGWRSNHKPPRFEGLQPPISDPASDTGTSGYLAACNTKPGLCWRLGFGRVFLGGVLCLSGLKGTLYAYIYIYIIWVKTMLRGSRGPLKKDTYIWLAIRKLSTTPTMVLVHSSETKLLSSGRFLCLSVAVCRVISTKVRFGATVD